MGEDNKELKELVKELLVYEKKLVSMSNSFYRGIFYGLGFFIGSAILVAVIIYILSLLLRNSPVSNQFQELINTVNNLK